jgi:ATP-binding cassette subfamily F protein 3
VLERPRDEWAAAGDFRLRFSTGDHRGGKEALKASGVTVGWPGAEPVARGVDVTIFRGERVGIVGPNGAGKTTLLRTLLGQIPPVAGEVERGHEVRVGYFDQKLGELDETRTLVEEIRGVRGDWNEDVVRGYLGMFRFSGDDPFRKVKGLSGGERNRMALAKMMLLPRNLLALDEPTNHLDIPACEVLEEALAAYDGTIVVVSHDRYFLDAVCTRLLVLHGRRVDTQLGNYSDWRAREKQRQAAPPEKKAPEAKRAPEKPPKQDDREQKRKADRERERKQRRFEELERAIAAAEVELADARAKLSGDHGGDWQKLNGLIAAEQALAQKVKSLLGEWEKLGAELDK